MEGPERRDHPRRQANARTVLSLETAEIEGTIINISDSGALVRITKNNPVEFTRDHVGREVSLRFADGAPDSRQARIIRFIEQDGMKLIALFFL